MGVYGRTLKCILTPRLAVLESGERNFYVLIVSFRDNSMHSSSLSLLKLRKDLDLSKNAFEKGLAL